MKDEKRFLPLALAFVMVLAVWLGLTLPAARAVEDFNIVDGVLTKYNGPGGDVVIPDGVVAIGWRAFSEGILDDSHILTSVTIPGSVTSIGKAAFTQCGGLTSVTTGNGVTSIGEHAFSECWRLTDVTMGNSVTNIGYEAFAYCRSLTGVTIPASVTSIEKDAFRGCEKLTTVCGAEGSYAQTWAAEKGLKFQATLPPAAAPARTAYASTQNILVNGVPVEFQAYALKDAAGNLTNYVKLRDVASVLNGTAVQFNVGWDEAVNVETGKGYTPNGSEMKTPFSGDRAYEPAAAPTNVNGAPAALEAIVLKDDAGGAYTYYKLRDLGTALGFTVDWSAEKGIFLETK